MTFMQKFLGATAALALSAGAALAEPALIFDLGGKFDKSFNEAAFNGAQRWAEETGGKFLEIELQSEAQREQALRRFAEAGANPVITTGFAFADPVNNVAGDYPDTKFVNIDGWLPEVPANVQLIGFQEHQGSYLVGMMAAMASKSGTVGFIGGMDIPLIRHFGCGYAQGVKAVNPDATVVANMTGTTPAAWNNPTKGAELARSQFDRGADVVYAAAGGTGVGVYQAAKDAGRFAIGVDSNQNYLHPGTMLTSMLKRVDVAAYNAFMSAKDGTWKPGILNLGLAEDGVGWALDEHNKSLISGEMESLVGKAQKDIVAGRIVVHDYMADNTCPH